MARFNSIIKDSLLSFLFLAAAYFFSSRFFLLKIDEHISTVFAFAVFLIALLTSSYIYGVISSFVSVFLINWAFTPPYYAFDFITTSNLISGVVMLIISVVTGLIVSSNKEHEKKEREIEKESMRANLLRAVSHDLRTPLTTINSASSLLLENETLTEMQKREMVERIKDDSEWLNRMVENLLTITRIDNRTMKIEKTSVIVDELIDSTVGKFLMRHPEEKVSVNLPDEIVTVPMDALLISQVLLNLLENASLHALGHTRIILSVYTTADDAVFCVEDDGCGIPEGKRKNIFSGYAERNRETESRFSGIGLAVSATIIKAHQGTIEAENRKAGGALFRFTLEREKDDD